MTTASSSNSHKYSCPYCHKTFNDRSNKHRHIKKYCKSKTNTKSNENTVKLQENDNSKTTTMLKEIFQNAQKGLVNDIDDDEKLQKLLSLITCNNTHNEITNNNININQTQNNVNLLNFKDTDRSHLTPKDFYTCINDCAESVNTLVTKTHFNDKKPENMNFYTPDLKSKYVMVFENGKWMAKLGEDFIFDVYTVLENILYEHYESKDNHPNHIHRNMKRYEEIMKDERSKNKAMERVKMTSYNYKDKVLEQKKKTNDSQKCK